MELKITRLRWSGAIVLLISLIAPSWGWAVKVEGLYQAEGLVPSKSAEDRHQQVREGLLQVLVRVSGMQRVEDNDRVQSALARPEAYLLQFSYETTDQSLETDEGESISAIRLAMQFDAVAVKRLLQEAGLPIWSENRPSLLSWVVVDGRDGSEVFVSVEEDPGLASGGAEPETSVMAEAGKSRSLKALLLGHGKRRGIPMILPLLDPTDLAAIAPSDIRGMFLERIRQASERYEPEAVMAGHVTWEPEGFWRVEWYFLAGSDVSRFEADAPTLDQALGAMVDTSVDLLARQYAAVDRGNGYDGLVLKVAEVRSLQDYADLLALLERLPMVEYAQTMQVQKDTLWIAIRLKGEARQLEKTLALDARLVPAGRPEPHPEAGNEQDTGTLSVQEYRWQP